MLPAGIAQGTEAVDAATDSHSAVKTAVTQRLPLYNARTRRRKRKFVDATLTARIVLVTNPNSEHFWPIGNAVLWCQVENQCSQSLRDPLMNTVAKK